MCAQVTRNADRLLFLSFLLSYFLLIHLFILSFYLNYLSFIHSFFLLFFCLYIHTVQSTIHPSILSFIISFVIISFFLSYSKLLPFLSIPLLYFSSIVSRATPQHHTTSHLITSSNYPPSSTIPAPPHTHTTHTYMHANIHAHIHTYIHTYNYARMHARMLKYTPDFVFLISSNVVFFSECETLH